MRERAATCRCNRAVQRSALPSLRRVAVVMPPLPGKAGKIEEHHITPEYLGGARNGPRVRLDAAYHQQITNEFRRLWEYGQGTPTAQQLERIMQQVYEKYPLPPGF